MLSNVLMSKENVSRETPGGLSSLSLRYAAVHFNVDAELMVHLLIFIEGVCWSV